MRRSALFRILPAHRGGSPSPQFDELVITFSEPVDAGSASEVGNYILDGGNLNTLSAVLQPNLMDVVLTTDAMTPGAEYVFTIQSVADRAVPHRTDGDSRLAFHGVQSAAAPVGHRRNAL